MENYKIYVHHNYTYELFWYFFHGLEVDFKKVPTHLDYKNIYHKNYVIESELKINGIYKKNKIEIIFCKNLNWNEDGFHYYDYSIDLLEKGEVSDRGFNSNIMNKVNSNIIPMLNKKADINKKIMFFYIDWEGHDSYFFHSMDKVLDKNITLVCDELENKQYKVDNKIYSFTHNIMSFIYPNTLYLRDYIFFHDYLKYKNDYKYKLNYPIRRLYGGKLELFNRINNLKNKSINITHSSFHDTKQYAGMSGELRKKILDSLDSDSFIEKRGYGIFDWGGEWNSNNMNEFLWKMFGIAEVSILPEYAPELNFLHPNSDKIEKLLSNSYLTEKTISHIFAGKPFIPMFYSTIEFYETMIKNYGYVPSEFPIKFNSIFDVIEEINEIANSNDWNDFKNKLQNWVDTIRNSILKIIDTNNDVLDFIVSKNHSTKKSSIL